MIDVVTILDAIKQHATECAPRECCGLAVVVSGKLRYWPCRNEYQGEGDLFIMSAADYAAAEDAGQVLAVVHSHVGIPPSPSQPDLVSIEQSKLPWLIVNHPTGAWTLTEPTGYKAPLLGRPWTHGVLDCYSLVRDYYRETLAIELPDYDRAERWWDQPGQNLYVEHFKAAGFFEIEAQQLRPHDGILMMIGADRPNHGAVYLGNNQIMQHLIGRLSSRDVWGGYWMRNATHFLRHKDLA